MDKSWIVGVNMFVDFALENSNNGDIIGCPCIGCRNVAFHPFRLVNLKYKEERSITKHTSEFQGLVDQLTSMNIVLDDE